MTKRIAQRGKTQRAGRLKRTGEVQEAREDRPPPTTPDVKPKQEMSSNSIYVNNLRVYIFWVSRVAVIYILRNQLKGAYLDEQSVHCVKSSDIIFIIHSSLHGKKK